MKGNILIISGPSGSGKSSLLNKLLKETDNIYFSISSTTRNIREGEKEGVNYYYISKEKFEEGIKNNEFLEWANVHGEYYGTSLKPVYEALKDEKIVIFDIDVQGYEIAKRKLGNLVTSVFVTTPNQNELKQRLTKRATDSNDSIDVRVSNAILEMQKINLYDYLLINDDFDETYNSLKCILNTLKLKVSDKIDDIINNWKK